MIEDKVTEMTDEMDAMTDNMELKNEEKTSKLSAKKKWSWIAGGAALVVAAGVFIATGAFDRNVVVPDDTSIQVEDTENALNLQEITDDEGREIKETDPAKEKEPLKIEDAITGGKKTDGDNTGKTDTTPKTPAQPATDPTSDAQQPSGGSTVIRTDGGYVEKTPDGHLHWGTDPGVSSGGTYSCGYPNHNCKNEGEHIAMLNAEARGCPFCGAHNCPSLYSMDDTVCPMYDITKDSTKYCQICGLPKGVGLDHCLRMIHDGVCPICNQSVTSGCHHCPGA